MGDVRRKKGPASGGTNWSFLQILNWGVIPQLLGCSVYGAKSGGNSTAFSHAVPPPEIDKKTCTDSYLVAVNLQYPKVTH